jgi:hypothetical protein
VKGGTLLGETATVKVTSVPVIAVMFAGWVAITGGGAITVSVMGVLEAESRALVAVAT